MKMRLSVSALATIMSLVTIAEANAWTRSGSVTRTGPHGHSVTRSGAVGCAAGVCGVTRTTTGPRGNSVTRSGVVRRGHVGHHHGYHHHYHPGRVAAGVAVGAVAANSAAYAAAPVNYATPPVVYTRPHYYARHYYGAGYYAPRPYHVGTVAYYRAY